MKLIRMEVKEVRMILLKILIIRMLYRKVSKLISTIVITENQSLSTKMTKMVTLIQ